MTDDDLDAELQRYASRPATRWPAIRARLEKDGELGRLAAGLRREKALSPVMSGQMSMVARSPAAQG